MSDKITVIEEQISKLFEELSEARRIAPSEPVTDYIFDNYEGCSVKLSELFGQKRDLLAVHNMGKECSYCTLWADGFNGLYQHIESRAAFVLISPDDPKAQRAFAASRGWKFRMVSCRRNSFAADMGFVREDGYWPGLSAFRKDDNGAIFRTGKATFGPGDSFCSVWHMFDLLDGGVAGWEPKHSY